MARRAPHYRSFKHILLAPREDLGGSTAHISDGLFHIVSPRVSSTLQLIELSLEMNAETGDDLRRGNVIARRS